MPAGRIKSDGFGTGSPAAEHGLHGDFAFLAAHGRQGLQGPRLAFFAAHGLSGLDALGRHGPHAARAAATLEAAIAAGSATAPKRALVNLRMVVVLKCRTGSPSHTPYFRSTGPEVTHPSVNSASGAERGVPRHQSDEAESIYMLGVSLNHGEPAPRDTTGMECGGKRGRFEIA